MNTATIVQKRWNDCNVLRDDGIFWLKDESLTDSDNLPAPDVIAVEIVEDMEAALEPFREILADLGPAPV